MGHPRCRSNGPATGVPDHNRQRRGAERTPWPSLPSELGIGIRRHFTDRGCAPLRRGRVGAPGLPDHQLPGRHRRLRAAGGRGPESWSLNATNILAQKYFRGTPGTAEREWSLRQVADRVVDTVTDWGTKDGYFVDERGGGGLPRRAQAPDHPPEGRVQLAGVVQHRRGRRAPAGVGLLHLVGGGLDGLDPQLVHRRGRHLQGWLGGRREPVAHPLVAREPQGWRAPRRDR